MIESEKELDLKRGQQMGNKIPQAEMALILVCFNLGGLFLVSPALIVSSAFSTAFQKIIAFYFDYLFGCYGLT